MKTYKLPITIENEEDKSYIKDLCRQQSIIVRSAYNDLRNGKTVKELEKSYKSLNSINDMDSWFIRCGILRGKMLTKHDKVVFGGKKNFAKLANKKITKEEWKSKRLYPVEVQGEENQGGNRKFELDLENGIVLFKPNRSKHISLVLPKIKEKWLNELSHIEENCSCFMIRLSASQIEIIVDEKHFACQDYTPKTGRLLGIDMNPDFVGISIVDYPSEEQVLKKCIETKELNIKSGKSSDSKESKYLKNKRNHEYIQIAKEIIRTAKHYSVEKIVVEDLNFKSNNFGKDKAVNRKNNYWMRSKILTKLKMDCVVNGIKLVEVNPAYSSVIGNLVHDCFDPVNASLEIGRRGFYQFVKGKFYPSLESVKHQWKEMVTEDIKTWRDLFAKIKTLDIRYRVPLDLSQVGCRISNRKACTNSYTFI